jgi:hypothetical protein
MKTPTNKLINVVLGALKDISPFMLSFNIILVGLTLGLSSLSHASSAKSYQFEYKPSKTSTFKIAISASSHDEAFKLAAKDCFSKLTGGKYPGEEKGLLYIDICANPKSSL